MYDVKNWLVREIYCLVGATFYSSLRSLLLLQVISTTTPCMKCRDLFEVSDEDDIKFKRDEKMFEG
jgi:hypothetical protein